MNATHTTSVPNHHAGQGGFSGIAGLLFAASSAFGRAGDAAWALELTNPAPAATVVDIGCGAGQAARLGGRRGLRMIGVDPSPEMLRVARRLDRSRAATYREGSAERLPVEDGAAEACWSIASVHHWSDVASGLAEVRRALAPGGRFAAIERRVREGATGHASHGWTSDQAAAFAQACRAAGFASVRVETRPFGRRRHLVAVVAALPA